MLLQGRDAELYMWSDEYNACLHDALSLKIDSLLLITFVTGQGIREGNINLNQRCFLSTIQYLTSSPSSQDQEGA
jgi:hypothetical protein